MERQSITLASKLIKRSSKYTTETELRTNENIDCYRYDNDNNNNDDERNNDNDNNNNTLTTDDDNAIIIKEKISSQLSFTKLHNFSNNNNEWQLFPR